MEKELNLASHFGMKEGFADLYAAIAISIIYPKAQATNIIQKIIDGRNYIDLYGNEFYHSKQSIEFFLNDFKSGKINFTKFSDVQSYIENTTSKNIISNLNKEINENTTIDSIHKPGTTKYEKAKSNIEFTNNFVNYYFGVLKK